MKSTQSPYPGLLKVAVAVSLAVGSLSAGSAIAGNGPDMKATGAGKILLDTDRLIVKYKDANVGSSASRVGTAMGATRQAVVNRAGQELGFKLAALRTMGTGAHVMKLDRRASVAEVNKLAAELMARDPSVEYAEPDLILTRQATVSDPRYGEQWDYFEATGGLRIPGAWDVSTGTGVKVAVLDTGIRPHADLSGQILPGYDFIADATAGNDGNGRDADASDPGDWSAAGECSAGAPASNSSWHGTHVAGTVAARANNGIGIAGVAYDARIVPVRVLGKCGGYTSDIADGIIWASGGTVSGVPANPNPVRVINMSLGGRGACGTTTQNAINGARSRGTVIVVAAGNDNDNVANYTPGNCSGVITVAATGRTGARASYSNYGTQVDVAAPGGDGANSILSTLNSGTKAPGADSYAGYQGTSMAAPHVAGVVALMLAKDPSLTPDQVEAKLKSTARAFPASCSGCGTGIVDATAALGGSTTTPPPPPPVVTTPTVSEIEPNDTISSANIVSISGTTVNGSMAARSDNDYFLVNVPVGKTLSATMTPGSATADYDLYIYNSAGTLLAYSENSAGAADSAAVSNAGNVSAAAYVRVKYYSGGTGSTSGKYALKLSW